MGCAAVLSIFRETLRPWIVPSLWVFVCLVLLLAGLVLLSGLVGPGSLALGEQLSGDLLDATGWMGRLGLGLLFPLLLGGFAARLGSWLVAGEMESGTLSLLLAQPVSRRSLLLGKALALVFTVTLLVLMLGVAVLFIHWLLGIHLRFDLLVVALLGVDLFALLHGSLALLLGCLKGSSRFSLWMAWMVMLAGLIFSLLGFVPEVWGGWPFLSPLWVLLGQNPLRMGIGFLPLLALAGLALLGFLLSWLAFDRRDLDI